MWSSCNMSLCVTCHCLRATHVWSKASYQSLAQVHNSLEESYRPDLRLVSVQVHIPVNHNSQNQVLSVSCHH